MTPGKLQKSFFTNSGSEAVEVAVILARLYTGQGDIIALRHCYSGGTLLAMNITAHSNWRLMDTAIPGIKHAHNAYCYRCAFGREYPSCNLECAKDMEELIKTTTCGAIAGFIAESSSSFLAKLIAAEAVFIFIYNHLWITTLLSVKKRTAS
ncbi:4-aminobutyrate aminotransferase [Candidatus Hakubella thermalkaliphila]|uniref:alanine--glyoxylate transaminase n=1 Tax=Candidatus Hakubella thermalkaliphila TaxID=2754717 RepID=A0A6V8NX99_9ACTN|nr:4-aminobutyrate aminotransferase [Candidatus Hakubella thermalkaliphila]